MSLIIRNIEKGDYKEVEILTREAFWNVYRPGCSEHLVLHNLHQNNKSIEDLELVVECDGKIVGHHLSLVDSFDSSVQNEMNEDQKLELINIYLDMIKKLQ